ncbi:Curved DNA-binding protein [Cytospora mali]|uniref:Curved DNA-binding protein n=1 Tax=Cytospora mali TaxID=578113 RepID=A0A194VLV8_CYTMA|nr:Curved DNA-binding protein [Valsa mali]
MATEEKEIDYTLNNPDTLTKYKTAAEISEKVLAAVKDLCVAGEKIVDICEKGDVLLGEEISKVWRGKKVSKGTVPSSEELRVSALPHATAQFPANTRLPPGFAHPTTVSPSSYVTPYTPLRSDEKDAAVELQEGEPVKIQLGAQIDGFASIVCDTVIVPAKENKAEVIEGKNADLMLATHYANELLLRCMLPPGVLASGTEEEKAKAAAAKPKTQAQINDLVQKIAKSYDVSIVESTTSWLFGRNEIEDKKKIVLAPGEGSKGDGTPEIGEVWGIEIGMSAGSGKVKQLESRATLHRRTATNYGLKRPTSRKIYSEAQKKFNMFPFSLRQLDDEKDAKTGVVECVRSGVFRQYELVGDKDNAPVVRTWTTIAITKNGITKLGGPAAWDLTKFKTDKKIEDEEILKILEQPLSKNKGKKKKAAKTTEA